MEENNHIFLKIQMIHILLLCNRENWGELEYIRNRRDELTSDRPSVEDAGIKMYKSQEGRYQDVQ